MNDALQTRMFTGHYAHGPRPITPFRERGAGGDASIDIDRSDLRNASVREATAMTFRAGAERIASATPDMRALHDRSRFKAGYHVASAAAASNGVHDGGSKPAPLGGYFGGALAPAQLEFRRSTAWKKLGLDVRDVDAYKKLVEASSAGRARRRPTSAPPDSARKSALDHADSSDDEKDVGPVAKRRPRGAAKPKKPVTQYRMKAPPPAGLTPNRRTSLDSYVDDAIDGLRRSTSQALGDVSADSPPEPARTALTPTQRRELALEVRAANASVSAPVDVALEADLERQIAEMELAAKDLEIKRAELKSPAGLPGGEDEGPSAAEIEAMEAELTRPLSAEQADAIERAYAPGSPSEIVASGKFTGQGVLEVRVYFFILVCGGD
jgi:sentrin-specific protease 1